MNLFKEKSLKIKLNGAFLFTLLLPLCILGVFAARNNHTNNIALSEQINQSSNDDIRKRKNEVEQFIKDIVSDFKRIADSHLIFDIENAINSPLKNVNLETNQTTIQQMDSFAEQMSSLIKSKDSILNIILIDKNLNELIKVQREGIHPVRSDFDSLKQSIRDKEIIKISKLEEEEIYISEMRLRRVNGKIHRPLEPVITINKKIYSANNNFIGILTLTIDTFYFLRWIPRFKKTISNEEYYLINRQGFFLRHPEEAREFAFDLPTRQDATYTTLFKNPISEISLEDSNEYKTLISNNSHQFLNYEFINFDPTNELRKWILIKGTPKTILENLQTSFASTFISVLILSIILILVLAHFIIRGIVGPLDNIVISLSKNAKGLAGTSDELEHTSTELSQGSTEQASSLQETVSSLDEIRSTVEKNSETCMSSKSFSEQSKVEANEGKITIQKMDKAIEDISKTQKNFGFQIEKSDTEISKIIPIISNISEKTKIINEIVFQTKLLSFNASVEAARAGEHGKGFSVVAEEVGALAQVSGEAAKAISEMLITGTQKIKEIINSNKEKTNQLLEMGNTKTKVGTVIASECNESLTQIIKNVSNVDALISGIASASGEQSKGVNEISISMNELDKVTQHNSNVAQTTSIHANNLKKQAFDMENLIQDLIFMINGKEKGLFLKNKKGNDDISSPNTKNFTSTSNESSSVVKSTPSGQSNVPDADDPRFEDV